MKRYFHFLLLLYATNTIHAQSNTPLQAKDPLAQTQWVDSIYANMTLEERVGQLFIPMIRPLSGKNHIADIERMVIEDHIGGVVFSTGEPVLQTNILNRLQSQSKLPLLATLDGEWGVGMRLDSVMDFPWNLTLGAIQDNAIIYEIGKSIGEQHLRMGLRMNYSPVLDVNSNPKNPIIGNRSFGEDPKNVAEKGLAMFSGMRDAGLLTSGKHFPGHGDTAADSHKTLPTLEATREQLDSIEWMPYKKLIQNGLHSVMVGHLNVPALTQENRPSSISKEIIQSVLKKDLGFTGMVITDAMDMKGVTDFVGNANADLEAFLAGNDVILVSADTRAGIKAIKKAYRRGKISADRLAHSVKKMLAAKYLVGLNKPLKAVETQNLTRDLNAPKDSLLYAKAMGAALTVLENKNDILPLNTANSYGYLHLGDASGAAFLRQLKQYGSFTAIQGKEPDQVKVQMKQHKALVIGFHRSDESPWKSEKFTVQEQQLIQSLQESDIPMVLAVFVKPYALDRLEHPKDFDGLIVSYQNNPIVQQLTADLIFGRQSGQGKLPVRIGDSYPVGHGIVLNTQGSLGYATPTSVGLDPNKLKKIDALAKVVIDSAMAPGMQILIARHGKICYQKSFGYHTYKKKKKVGNNDVYDLASLTKILGTLPLIMQAKDSGHIQMKTPLKEMFPSWKDSNKADVTIRQMLSHYARLTPWIPFYKETLDDEKLPKRRLYRSKANRRFPTAVSQNLFLKKGYEDKIFKAIKESPMLDSLYYRYSDLPFIIFKKYLEKRYNKPLDQQMQERFYQPLGLKRTLYNAASVLPAEAIVPSENDTYFRYTELDGYVHDMGAAMLGGVGGHAGLFSNAYEVAVLMQMYLQKGSYGGQRFFAPETFDLFNTCHFCDEGNRRGVGLDKPFLDGSQNTCGCVSKQSFGHLGFTGTYAWADPSSQIVFVFLSNRTYPTMENNLLGTHNIRTRMQGLVEAARLD